jgi:hypothetical protein
VKVRLVAHWLVVASLGCASDASSAGTAKAPATAQAPACERTARVHRATPAKCDSERAPGTLAPPGPMKADCNADSDCTEGRNGRCHSTSVGGATCSYDECLSDADCPADQSCACGEGDVAPNRCVGGDCLLDTDCEGKASCSPSYGECGPLRGVQGNFCHTCEDECLDDLDCFNDKAAPRDCRYRPELMRWACTPTFSCSE